MADTEMFLSRDERNELSEHLREVPDLIAPLALAIIRGDRHGLDTATSRPAPQSRPPVDHGAEELRDDLHNTLTTWVRLVCEERVMSPPEYLDTEEAAHWLDKYITALAMTVGAEDAHRSIIGIIQAVQRRLDHRGDAALTEDELAGANRMVITAYQIEKVLHLLGERGEGLNRRRVEVLDKAGALQWCSRDKDTGMRFYRIGDILEAHATHPRRGRGSAV
ncbi:hypothetical protein [Nocardia fluminea]|uniref:Uncharacterized protein n=1 Tax=Nocardia fluminea TaxID=134984 RepID=A0A2N3VGX6_9NOCA|nr:hypothetical protein [Nocardia fluminea]PKV80888.1 hypothetical protein ATK86_5325 [Nocardia fluminea]